MRAEYAPRISEKEQETKEFTATVEASERHYAGLSAHLNDLEFKTSEQPEESERLWSDLTHVQQQLEGTESQSITLRRDLEKAEEQKSDAEQRMNECIRGVEEAEHMRKIAERDSKRAIEAAEKSRAEEAAEER
ncbi:hypothetical protein KC19_10G000200 [Ceratodon purpureus]|uniref:Uncharacterized protein n=1 Tax=Ceratodon purpureus TaxID=3225 RepID=A0A8T0GLY0_CERPU|nr:hypothetical protein KC19_10G000200 [Ceratodon purpureus]